MHAQMVAKKFLSPIFKTHFDDYIIMKRALFYESILKFTGRYKTLMCVIYKNLSILI